MHNLTSIHQIGGRSHPRGPLERRSVLTFNRSLQPIMVSADNPALGEDAARRCRVCGCTDGDCRQCIEATGMPCVWVEEDLCSACAERDA
jgi:hypothetical protein